MAYNRRIVMTDVIDFDDPNQHADVLRSLNAAQQCPSGSRETLPSITALPPSEARGEAQVASGNARADTRTNSGNARDEFPKRSKGIPGLKGYAWSITLNNPTEEEKQRWANLKNYPQIREQGGQLERGAEGTAHVQAWIKTKEVRHSWVCKLFPRAHVEKAENVYALQNYCAKEDTRLGELETNDTSRDMVISSILATLLSYSSTHRICQPMGRPKRGDRSIFLYPADDIGLMGTSPNERTHFIWRFPTTTTTTELLMDYHVRLYLKENALELVDEEVGKLIREGNTDLAWVYSNPTIRGGFKNYLPDILVGHARRQEDSPPSETQPATTTTDDTPPDSEDEEESDSDEYSSRA